MISTNTNKTVLWNDPLLGQYDRHIVAGCDKKFAETAIRLKELANRDNRLSYIFNTIYCLCDFLSSKAEIGNGLREAYTSHSLVKLVSIKNELPEIIDKLDIFHRTFRNNWLKENKVFGFDIQDIRFGGLRARLVYTSDVLEQYLNGDIKTISELEQPSLYLECRDEYSDKALHFCYNSWEKISTLNII